MDSICRLSRRMGTPVVSVTINLGDWRYEVVLRNVLRNDYVEVLRNGSFPRVWYTTKKFTKRPETPPILITEAVYTGLKRERPAERSIVKGWLTSTDLKIPDYPGTVYGCDVIYTDVKDP